MTGSLLDRALRLLELLAEHPAGLRLQTISGMLLIPKSAAHRLLAELAQYGYVRQAASGDYMLTSKLLTVGYAWLGGSGLGDLVQPALDALASVTGELVRYAVLDGERLVWLLKAQGARFGLRLDPDQGMEAVLYCTATGHAWLATLDDEAAVAMVMRQGLGTLASQGPNAPTTVRALLAALHAVRVRGYAVAIESSAVGTAAMATPVRAAGDGRVLGVLSISGPSVRLTEARMHMLAEQLAASARDLALLMAQEGWRGWAPERPPIGRGSFPPAEPVRRRAGAAE